MSETSSDRPVTGAPGSAMATLVATLFGNLYLILGSALFGSLAAVSGWVPPRGSWPRNIARLWARGLLKSSGVRLRVERACELEPGKSYILMPNHTSLMDIPVLLATARVPLCFVAKRGLFSIPIFGWALSAAGYLPVDRKDRRSAPELFQLASQRLRDGSSILIFPEETRSVDGHLLSFKRGGFLLAIRSGCSIVPVGIRGSGRVRRKGSMWVHPRTVEIHYGIPLKASARGLRGKQDLVADVRRQVAVLAATPAADEGPTVASS